MISRGDLEADYARTLAPLARMWRQAADRALDGVGLTAGVAWALVQINRMDDNVRQIDLARELDLSGASLVRLIDQMEDSAHVERHRDPADNRVSRVRLTDRGRSLAEQAETVLHQVRQEILACETTADLAVALSLAQRLRDRIAERRGA